MHIQHKCFYIFCFYLLIISFTFNSSLFAQKSIVKEKYDSLPDFTGKTWLDGVVVTGMARATHIRQSPLPVALVREEQLNRSFETNIVDALVKNTEGVFSVKTGPNISKPFIRGLGYNRVLTLYDGIRQEGQQWGDEHGIEIDAYNQGRIEVVKGPASIMYGSDALAGVIAFYPNMPKDSNAWQARIISEYQSNNGLIGNGGFLGYRYKNIVFALRGSHRLAKNYRNRKTQEIYGNNQGRVHNTGFNEGNLSLLVGYENPKHSLHFNLSLYNNLQAIPDGSRDSSTLRFTYQDKDGEEDDPDHRPVVANADLNLYKTNVLHQHIQHYRAYVNASHKMGESSLTWTLGFQQNNRREFVHPSYPTQAGLFVRLNTISYSLRYNLPTIKKQFQLSFGFNGMTQINRNLKATDFPIPDYLLYGGGAYVHTKWKHKKWNVSGAIRYDLRNVGWKDFYTIEDSRGFDTQASASAIGAKLLFAGYNKFFHGISAILGVAHSITEFLSWKFNIGRGYRAPNITEIGSNGLDPGAHIIYVGNRNFSPEFSLQEDLGISLHTQDFSLDFSVYNNNITGFIYLNLQLDEQGKPKLDPQGNKTYHYEQSIAQLYGLETYLLLHPRIIPGLFFRAGMSMTYGFNRGKQFDGKGVNGGYLPLIPPLKIQSTVAKRFSLPSKWLTAIRPNLEMELNGYQNRYLGLNNTETPTPGYVLLGAGLEFNINHFRNQTMSLSIQASNLLNTLYQSHLSRLKYFESWGLGMYGMGRNVSFKLILPF